MGRFWVVAWIAASLGLVGGAAGAQTLLTPNFATAPAPTDGAKPHKKSLAKSAPPSEEAERAARLAEGRKKFFERSMGFDESGKPDAPVSLGNGNGLAPSAGFKF
jgi:hypothetical protein